MSLGQTMISAAFFVLLTLAVLSANKMILENTKYYLQEEATEQASNFANALLGEILTKKFDSQVQLSGSKVISPYDSANWPWPSYTGGPWPYYPDKFDAPGSLGPSAAASSYVNPSGKADVVPYKSVRGDNGNYFDDIDDYKGYKRTANSADISGYTLTVNVYYVSRVHLSSPSRDTIEVSNSYQTFYKRIDVTVTHSIYLPKALTFSAIATY